MAFDPIQEDCHRLVLEALRRDNIPLTDGAAVERLMEQFTRNPAPLIVHDRDRAGHLIAKVVEAVDYRIPFIPDDTQAEQEEAAAENMLREAAALDGAGAWTQFRRLTLPALGPIFLILTALSTIWDFRVFTQVYVLQKSGGIARETDLLGLYAYRVGFSGNDFGVGSAIGVMMVLMLLIVSVFYIRRMIRQIDEAS